MYNIKTNRKKLLAERCWRIAVRRSRVRERERSNKRDVE